MEIGIFVFAMILLLIVLIMQKSVAIKALIIHIQYNAYVYATLIVYNMMDFSAFLQHYKLVYNILEAEILYDSICSTNITF